LTNLGLLAEYRGAFAEAESYYKQGLAIARALGHKERISNLLQNLGSVADYTGRFDEALALNGQALTVAREIGHVERTAALLQERGAILLHADHLAEAELSLREGLDLAESLEHNERKAALKGCLAELATRRGDYNLALTYLKEAEDLAGALGHRWHSTYLLLTRGEIELARDRAPDARSAFARALEVAEKLASQSALGESHFGLARCAVKMADREEATSHGSKAHLLFLQAGHYKAEIVSQWLAGLNLR
jgi:tetratricopeptide (TPR) repeat protein